MEPTIIRICNSDGKEIIKDIADTTEAERYTWYNTLSKGQIASLFEKYGGFKK